MFQGTSSAAAAFDVCDRGRSVFLGTAAFWFRLLGAGDWIFVHRGRLAAKAAGSDLARSGSIRCVHFFSDRSCTVGGTIRDEGQG